MAQRHGVNPNLLSIWWRLHQVKKRPVGFRPRAQAMPSRAAGAGAPSGDIYGPTFATIEAAAVEILQRCGSPTHLIAKEPIPSIICMTSPGC